LANEYKENVAELDWLLSLLAGCLVMREMKKFSPKEEGSLGRVLTSWKD